MVPYLERTFTEVIVTSNFYNDSGIECFQYYVYKYCAVFLLFEADLLM